ncbi:hypothetical protein EMIHUDRAFT_77834, partial [Emiliania huxleyi CCMP1516]|uniref:Kinesin motor domain-containing protein n=2 Tax=Emiliania huxleyi TaxID=2903 RepID=A0A0D3KSC3_EMIH1
LTFVDLAGSERTKRARTEGEARQEGNAINLSLLNLNNVIKARADRSSVVPYNSSSLTKLLADRLGGATPTLVLACASPEGEHADETISTLQTMSLARMIETRPKIARRPATISVEEAARQAEEAARHAVRPLRRP